MGRLLKLSFVFVFACTASLPLMAQDATQPLAGQWVVTDLVEDGKVIPRVAIPEWIPSGGKLEIADGAILFTSHADGRKHARLFTIDAARIPNVITLTDSNQTRIVGITKNEGGRLVVCLSAAGETTPPSDFSAEAGSKRMLMVLQRAPAPVTATAPAPAAIPQTPAAPVAATVVTDADITRMLGGTWKFDDQYGSLIITYRPNGTYSTTRAAEEMRLFKTVFVETPLSGGTWKVLKSQLLMTVTSSINPDRLGHTFPFTIRSISATDIIFVDYFGRVGQAKRIAQ